jgi:hypothetical protein
MTSHLDQYTYILDADHKPVQCANDDAWFAWYQDVDKNRRVARTEIDATTTVSTVFTSLDLRPQRGHLFETKIFGGKHDNDQWLTATWEEAELQHDHVVAMLRHAQRIEQQKTEAQAATTDEPLR